MMRYLYLLVFSLIFSSCSAQEVKSSFEFEKNDQGVELKENGQPVFFYQKIPKSLNGEYSCNNYLHPLYSLSGDALTEEFPTDHPYHRGIFWAWHQIYINGKSVGDGWIMENIEQEVIDVQTTTDNPAQLKVNVLWRSPLYKNSQPFVREQTTITVHPLQNSVRKIDFAIALKAMVPGVEIGGSEDEKGYGGLCARIRLPEDLTFTSTEGPIVPQTKQIEAGPWMDFSSSFFNRDGTKAGMAILCHPQTPNHPAPWILRSKTSMQNIVFPGSERVALSMEKPVVLYYRLIVHQGDANSIPLNELQSEYESTVVEK